MVVFEDETERDYFNDRMMIGEVARITMTKILTKLETINSLTRDEIMLFQKEAIEELKEQVEKLNAEELKEEADKQNGIAGEQEK
jgi:CCR4-NOT transcriptional regulation complex NOT5 subunit